MTTPVLPIAPAQMRDVRVTTALLLVFTIAFFVALHLRGEPAWQPGAPHGFSVSPQGEGVQRTSQVKVSFRFPTKEKDGSKLVTIDPPVQGDFVWQGDRTLIFQPAFPGLLRGRAYTVNVQADGAAGLYDPFSFQFTTGDELTVLSVIPAPDDIEVPANAQVLVQFSRSVAPLTTLSEQPDAPVVLFDPPLKGTGEWLNTSLYRFVPEAGALGTFTQYRLRVPSHLTGEADGSLKDDYVWSFTTASPAIAKVTPDNNTKFAAPFQPVSVAFTQPMNRAFVEAGLRVNGPDGVPASGSFAWSDNDTAVKFTPAQAYAPEARYELTLAKGLRSTTGGETRVEWRSMFESAPLPRVVSTTPVDGARETERYGISLLFSVPMDEDSFKGLVSVSDVAKEDVTMGLSGESGVRLYVNARLEPSKAYTVTLAAGAKDRYGRSLGAHTFSFTTGKRPPSLSLAIPAEVATYAASAEPVLYFHATNMDYGEFKLYPLTAAEVARMQLTGTIDPPGVGDV